MKPIQKVLIANRGEIACRIIRTCRAMGIATVAVFSDADADALHVRLADEAVRIGPPAAVHSYLHINTLVGAALRTGADAVHPGYGFLAESEAFATACKDRGLTFIGPSPAVIALLGSKRASKRVVAAAGVPVVPGYGGEAQDEATLIAEAEKIGFPVLLKASAGGGGKGMRVVRAAGDLPSAIASAKREAKSAFGDDTLLIEAYIERPRHVEFQILGDSHGNLIHLFERECSIQRRHQKIIEESPSPALTDALRETMGQAAIAVGKAVGYENAGTVEFIVAPDERFYFLEVNTRLQVEHPVTELVTGVDIVAEQIRIAQGLPLSLGNVRLQGAALECRLYAEDADHGFLPTTGTVVDWHVPEVPGVRVDSGISAGSEVSIYYDPMLAKIICHAPTRAEAVQKMRYVLGTMSVAGVVTNREFLIRVLAHEAFLAGQLDTHFLDTHGARLAFVPMPVRGLAEAAVFAVLFAHERRRRERTILPALEPGFRNSRFGDETVLLLAGDRQVAVAYRNLGERRFALTVSVDGGEPERMTVALTRLGGAELSYEEQSGEHRGIVRRARVVLETGETGEIGKAGKPGVPGHPGDARYYIHGRHGAIVMAEAPRFQAPGMSDVRGGCMAPMPGKVVKVLVTPGHAVRAGQVLVILEAMKMEHPVVAPEDGAVAEILVREGEQVDSDRLLVVIEPAS